MNTIIITVLSDIPNTSEIQLAIFSARLNMSRSEAIFLDSIEEVITVNLN